ncbi:N-6 DNA methylase [Escherichia coli]|nr:N-6 DNA methylase [Escherichia coli]
MAPKSKADFAFVLHALNYLSTKGRRCDCLLPGYFLPWRRGAENPSVSGR